MPDVIKIDRNGNEALSDEYSWKSLVSSSGQSTSSRYRSDNIIINEKNNSIYRETYSKKGISPSNLKYFKITPAYEYRPDMLSEDMYNSSRYWYVILEMNGLSGFDQFVRGLTIVVPASEAVIRGV